MVLADHLGVGGGHQLLALTGPGDRPGGPCSPGCRCGASAIGPSSEFHHDGLGVAHLARPRWWSTGCARWPGGPSARPGPLSENTCTTSPIALKVCRLVSVSGGYARALLPSVLQRVQPEEGDAGHVDPPARICRTRRRLRAVQPCDPPVPPQIVSRPAGAPPLPFAVRGSGSAASSRPGSSRDGTESIPVADHPDRRGRLRYRQGPESTRLPATRVAPRSSTTPSTASRDARLGGQPLQLRQSLRRQRHDDPRLALSEQQGVASGSHLSAAVGPREGLRTALQPNIHRRCSTPPAPPPAHRRCSRGPNATTARTDRSRQQRWTAHLRLQIYRGGAPCTFP